MPLNHDDERLLARLNALKPSTIGANSNHETSYSSATETKKLDEDIASRFLRLASQSQGSGAFSDGHSTAALLVDSGGDDHALPNPLNKVTDDYDWGFDGGEDQDIDDLLKEAEIALKEAELSDIYLEADPHNPAVTDKQTKSAVSKVDQTPSLTPRPNIAKNEDEYGSNEGKTQLTEEEEVEEHIKKVLAELAIEQQQSDTNGSIIEPSSGNDPTEGATENVDESTANVSDSEEHAHLDLGLPNAPFELPDTPADEENLPSAPTLRPLKKKNIGRQISPPRISFDDLDDEIETWCVICNDDATVKCKGCDGDLYCANCWKEGHMGEYAGLEERGHQWTKYNPKRA